VLGAADTFRAAAADQLQTWGSRVGAETVRGPEGGDPASVAFEAVKRGIEARVDTVLIDTAGRLHTKTGLMDELGKVKRVVSRRAEDCHRKAATAPFPEIVESLVSIIGRRLTAYISSVTDARAIDRWIAHAKPQKDVEQRLRLAYHIAGMLSQFDTHSVVQAWFIGLNPELEDQVPGRLLRDGDLEVDGKRVLGAARAFVAGG